MSMSLKNHDLHDPGSDRLIDRLVDGELPEIERRELLLRLETVPDGWRRCALAFLEAQSWREALASAACEGHVAVRIAAVPSHAGRRTLSWRTAAGLTALAACFVGAFLMGWTLQVKQTGNPTPAPLVVAERSAAVTSSGSASPESNYLAAQDNRRSRWSQASALLVPLVKQWEQHGYSVVSQTRPVSMQTQDGRKLNVPAHELRLHYIGGRTY
jgi:anti-sigma factor RsiW